MVYNRTYIDGYRFSNHFPYELYNGKYYKYFYLNIFLLLTALLFTGNFVLKSITDFSPIQVVLAVLSLFASFTLLVLFYLPLTKLRERCICSIGFFISNSGINGLIIYQEVRNIRINESYLYLLPLIISLLILIVCIFSIFNPKIFDFKTIRNKDGVQVRPFVFHLALCEWLLIFTFLFSQIYFFI